MPDESKQLVERLRVRSVTPEAVGRNVLPADSALFNDAADLIERQAAVLDRLANPDTREACEAAIDGSDVLSPTWGDWPLDGLIEAVLAAALQHAQEQVGDKRKPEDGEVCNECGKPVGLVWWCHDELLWEKVTGHPKPRGSREPASGVLCIPCFDAKAKEVCPWIEWAPLNLRHLQSPEESAKSAKLRWDLEREQADQSTQPVSENPAPAEGSDREYMDGGEPGGKCPCGRPDPGIKPEGGCWCTEKQEDDKEEK